MKEDKVYDIAKWFLHEKEMTHKKLQKLLYFSYGIYLTENNDDIDNINDLLFLNDFEAWVHGPVVPSIYNRFKNYGITPIGIVKEEKTHFEDKVLNALRKTIDKYGDYSADELEKISHNQTPWIKARKNLSPIEPSNNIINIKDIYLTFKEA